MFFTNPEIKVFKEIPSDGILVDSQGHINDWKYIFTLEPNEQSRLMKPEHHYYYCGQCDGYIQGHPSIQGENTIGPLVGRCGKSHRCLRCWYELNFDGYYS